ncbi:hypothetical protein [Neolewinella xylanilytica]|uniref:hypothetical protein n=1 Tax=Neolewinella xylanilytica TaxID=1514080 RepID=UPI0014751E78|nr:hypothetical protein [Neolewinella xylanilytica]
MTFSLVERYEILYVLPRNHFVVLRDGAAPNYRMSEQKRRGANVQGGMDLIDKRL